MKFNPSHPVDFRKLYQNEINLFSHFLVVFRFYEGLNFWGTSKKCEDENVS